jgi:methanogenic corrinoid protein MtbC1
LPLDEASRGAGTSHQSSVTPDYEYDHEYELLPRYMMPIPDEIVSKLNAAPPVSREAAAAFADSLPKVVRLVDERFQVEARHGGRENWSRHLLLLRDSHERFGATLRTAYRFGLSTALAEDFAWLVIVLHSRGLGTPCFRTMLDAWMTAIHGTIAPGFARQLVAPLRILREGIAAFVHEAEATADQEPADRSEFLQALLQKERDAAQKHIDSLLERGADFLAVCKELLLPALGELGTMWQRDLISAADEHAATEICKEIMVRLCDAMPRERRLPYSVLIACAPGEEHEVGAHIAGSYLQSRGWTVYFVGRSAPENDIAAAVTDHRPNILLVGLTLIANLGAAVTLVGRLRDLAPGVKIIAGGPGAVRARPVLEPLVDGLVEDVFQVHDMALALVHDRA